MAVLGHDSFDDLGGDTTKEGISKLELMVELLIFIEHASVKQGLADFKTWVQGKIGREITPKEELRLCEGILKYIKSEPITDERSAAMKFLFNTGFLDPIQQ